MNEQKLIIDENTTVLCPWCRNMTEFDQDEEVQCCQICQRFFTEENLDYEQHEED
jgi:uncharacterized CHY-type Zn-finger protein